MGESKGRPPSGGKGIASGLQPGASQGSIGTGGASTDNKDSGNVARRERKFGNGEDEESKA